MKPEVIHSIGEFKPIDRSAELDAYIKSHRFDPANHPPDDDHILFLGDCPIGSKENIITITGKSKSRKTIAASAIASSIFRGPGSEPFLSFTSNLPDTVPILHIDTEQGYKHYYHSVERIFRDAAIDPPARFTSLHTRDADIPMRLDLISHLCASLKPGVLIVDGLTDLVYDINDQAEATKIGEIFLKLSSEYKLLVIGIIHTTKTTGYMTGAIGTIFEKKSETVIKVELDEVDKMVSQISCQFSRNRPFKDFAIRADEQNNYTIENEDNITTKGEIDPNSVPIHDLELLFTRSFGQNQSIQLKELQKAIRKHAKDAINRTVSVKSTDILLDFMGRRGLFYTNPAHECFKGFTLPIPSPQLEIPKVDDKDLPF